MDLLRFIRNHPDFAPLFDYVYVLCWSILIWEILRVALWMRCIGTRDFLYSVDKWGFIGIEFAEDDPSVYRPILRTFRPFTDPACASL